MQCTGTDKLQCTVPVLISTSRLLFTPEKWLGYQIGREKRGNIEKYRNTWHPTRTCTSKLGYLKVPLYTYSSIQTKHTKEHFHMMYNTQGLYFFFVIYSKPPYFFSFFVCNTQSATTQHWLNLVLLFFREVLKVDTNGAYFEKFHNSHSFNFYCYIQSVTFYSINKLTWKLFKINVTMSQKWHLPLRKLFLHCTVCPFFVQKKLFVHHNI